jgi:hypothetical protein
MPRLNGFDVLARLPRQPIRFAVSYGDLPLLTANLIGWRGPLGPGPSC